VSVPEDLIDYLDGQTSGVSFARALAMPSIKAPYVVVTQHDRDRGRTTGTTSPVKVTHLELECWHTNTSSAESLANTILGLLEDFTGNLTNNSPTTDVMGIVISNEHDGPDSASELYYYAFTVQISHR